MRLKTLLAGIIAFAGVSGAYAQCGNTFTGSSPGNWNTNGNWSLGHVPTQAEQAVIPSSKVVNYNTANSIVGRLSVSGTLNIQTGNLLQVDGAASCGTNGDNFVDGTINIQGAASQLQFTSMNQILEDGGAGTGKIVLSNATADLLVDNALTLSNQIQIEGYGRIKTTTGAATLDCKQVNASAGSVLRANASGTLLIDSSMALAETPYTSGLNYYYPKYRAETSSSAILEFGASATLGGDFFISDCAQFRFDDSVITEGNLILKTAAFDGDVTFAWPDDC